MRFLRRKGRHEADAVKPESARALEVSRERLRRDREELIGPLERLIERNNVTELVRQLVRDRGRADGHGAAAG